MKTDLLKGELVKNSRSGEVGILIGEELHSDQNSDGTIYYKVLSKNGRINSWFKNHIEKVEVENERANRACPKYLA